MGMHELILVVDDEPKIVRLVRDYLEKDGYKVLSAEDGDSALAMARRSHPDLIVLDVMLPGMDGWEVCRILRREMDTPIILLTARAEESDQVLGLGLGADEYVTKPFSPRTLTARVQALLRRARGQVRPAPVVRAGRLVVDLAGHRVTLDGNTLHLTPNEFRILAVLVQHPGQTLSRQQLIDDLHGGVYTNFDRSIDSHIKNLRRKLDNDPSQPDWIETVYGIGYRFIDLG
jgi:DNA-binding response OmpR family regulator